MPVASIHQALTDVTARRDGHAQSITRVLVNDAPGGAHEAPSALLVEREDVRYRTRLPREPDAARRWPIETGKTAQQRGLP